MKAGSDKKNNKVAPDAGMDHNEFLSDNPPEVNPVLEDEGEDENHPNKILDRS